MFTTGSIDKSYQTKHYNLDAVIAVGYRTEYFHGKDYFDEMLERIQVPQGKVSKAVTDAFATTEYVA